MAMLFKPADYNPVANPWRAKANSPVHLYAALVVAALVVWVVWSLWPLQVRVVRPTLDIASDKIVASTLLTNGSSVPRSVTIRFDLGYQIMGTESAPSEFRVIASREVAAHIAARTTETITCEFPRPPKPLPSRADAQIVRQRESAPNDLTSRLR
jgi:hypothetical protein